MSNVMFKLASLVTGLTESSLDPDAEAAQDLVDTAYNTFRSVMGTILPILIAVVLFLGLFFGISLGIKFAKAEDTDARDKAKGQLINLAIGVGVAAVILIICNVLIQTNVFEGLFSGLKA